MVIKINLRITIKNPAAYSEKGFLTKSNFENFDFNN